MTILKTLARMAVHRFANDPELQAKVSKAVKEELIPRAKKGWEQAKPELKKAQSKAQKLATKLKNNLEK
ncbi:uncharacterized protein METZ01_LOCUS379491 [marine metagenome]|uniref:Uncharacterized protein n=1 Tax=marine metagenome TaxID=408172 RepID=A0A382TY66_9ZZZZ